MKNTILNREWLKQDICRVLVELTPENEIEANAIINTGVGQATESERNMLDNYLILNLNGLGNYSIIDQIQQFGNRFVLEIVVN